MMNAFRETAKAPGAAAKGKNASYTLDEASQAVSD
jgi:hypothetical protein